METQEEDIILPGDLVKLVDLQNVAWLNGLTGTVVGPDVDRPGRWQVDLGEEVGIKALMRKNIVSVEQPGDATAPGDLIQRLLEEDAPPAPAPAPATATTAGNDEDVDVIAEALDEAPPKEAPESEAGVNEATASPADGPSTAEATQEESQPKAEAPAEPETTAETTAETTVPFTQMSIKELKNFLQRRGVRVPASIAEKKDLVDLVDQSKDLPVRSEEELQRAAAAQAAAQEAAARAEAEKAKEAKEAKEAKAKATESKESAEKANHWQPPGPWTPLNNMGCGTCGGCGCGGCGACGCGGCSGCGCGCGCGGCSGCGMPTMPTMPTMPGYQTPMAPKFGAWPMGPGWPLHTGVGNPQPNVPLHPPGQVNPPQSRPTVVWPPKTRENALTFQANRLLTVRLSHGVLQNLTRFCKYHHLLPEAETSLKMLGDRLQPFLSDNIVREALERSLDPHQTLIEEVQKRDTAAAVIMRLLLPEPKPAPACTSKAAPPEKKPAAPSPPKKAPSPRRPSPSPRSPSRSRRVRHRRSRGSRGSRGSRRRHRRSSRRERSRRRSRSRSSRRLRRARLSSVRRSTSATKAGLSLKRGTPLHQDSSSSASSDHGDQGVWRAPDPVAPKAKAMPKTAPTPTPPPGPPPQAKKLPPTAAPRTPPKKGGAVPSAKPSMAPAVKKQTAAKQEDVIDTEEEVMAWLRSLDSGRGALVGYGPVILEQFGSLAPLSSCVISQDGTVMSRIETSLWDVLNVKSLGHRLLLAKGILAL